MVEEGGGGSEKLKKREWKYGAGAGVLKGGRGGLALFLLHFLKVYHFYIKKLL